MYASRLAKVSATALVPIRCGEGAAISMRERMPEYFPIVKPVVENFPRRIYDGCLRSARIKIADLSVERTGEASRIKI